MQRRTGLRRLTATLTIAAFLAAFAGLSVQMAAGDDPALSRTAQASSSGTTTSAPLATSTF
jgi:hypothetical protein